MTPFWDGKDIKAVILAGGEGTRLRPLSLNKPKPMVPLFEKPVLEHTIAHLKRNGITDMIAALRTLPHTVTDYFGDGSSCGVTLGRMVESEPLGTAGAVRACGDFLGDSPFLVISGDGVCDFDFRAALEFHMERKAEVTVLLYRHPNLLSYGLVMTDRSGRITRFIEKPSWGQVFADTVNTGVYIIDPKVLEKIPENSFYDFAQDLFPLMLAEGRALYGYVADGYWCDIGDAAAYLQCAFDVLDGKLRLGLPAPEVSRGVWSDTAIPPGTRITPPCYIGSDVRLGRGVRLGPYTVLTSGTSLDDGAVVERSYLDGVTAGAHADISGAIVCRGVTVGQGARLHEGCVLGEGVSVGAHAVVQENCRVWPGKEIAPGTRAAGSVTAGARTPGALFEGGGRLSGQPNVDLTPDTLLRLGAAMAVVAGGGQGATVAMDGVAVSRQGGEAARVAASLLEAGAASAGCNVTRHDAGFAACAAYAGGLYRFPLSVFVSQSGNRLNLSLFGADGLPIERAAELKLEALTARGEAAYREARAVGVTRTLTGLHAMYAASAAEPARWFRPRGGLTAAVRGAHAAGQALTDALRGIGCALLPETRMPVFETAADGLTASAIDERGRVIPHERLLCLLCLYEASQGSAELAVPYSAPMLLERMDHRLNIRRPGRDPNARVLLAEQPYMRDGVFMLTRLAAALMTSGLTLSDMNDAVPPFHLSSIEMPVGSDRGAVMRALAEECEPDSSELVEGLRTRRGDGWVHVAPLPGRRALRITSESADAETADELCRDFRERALAAERKNNACRMN